MFLLPNVTGTWHSKAAGDVAPTGAIYGIGSKVGGSQDDLSPGYEDFGFDASRSNAIFGALTHVQPRAYQCLIIIKA